MDKTLQRQVEQIIDTGSGQTRNVIIRMGPADSEIDKDPMVAVASQAIRRRTLTTTARDTLPLALGKFPKDGTVQPPAIRRQLVKERVSIAAQAALFAAAKSDIDNLRNDGLQSLDPLMESEIIKNAMHRVSENRRRNRPPGVPPRRFWSSRSLAMEIGKEELAALPEQVPQIRDIYLNRTLSLPHYVEAKRLPQAVEDNKGSSWGVNRIGALAAWGAYEARGQGIRIGLLDTGVDATHPDLDGKIESWAEFDQNGNEVPNSMPHDTDQHGTHTAGTLVGGNRSGQWIGVAPEAKLAAALVLNGQHGATDAQILAGIDWAIEQSVDVINMSLGGVLLGPEVPSTYTEAILNALRLGIPVVVAIGNEGHQTTGSPGNDLFAFAVGATDHEDRIAGFSGGRTQVVKQSRFLPPETQPMVYSKPEVSAPGVAIHSAIPGGKWASFNGTSMAAPHVAGAIAVLLSATSLREVSPIQRAFIIQELMTGSVEELGEAGQDHRYGFGRIDILRAIGFAKEKGF